MAILAYGDNSAIRLRLATVVGHEEECHYGASFAWKLVAAAAIVRHATPFVIRFRRFRRHC